MESVLEFHWEILGEILGEILEMESGVYWQIGVFVGVCDGFYCKNVCLWRIVVVFV